MQEKLRLIAKDNYVRNLMILNAVCNHLEICLYCLASELLGIFPKLSLPLENLQKSWDGNLRVISEIYLGDIRNASNGCRSDLSS